MVCIHCIQSDLEEFVNKNHAVTVVKLMILLIILLLSTDFVQVLVKGGR